MTASGAMVSLVVTHCLCCMQTLMLSMLDLGMWCLLLSMLAWHHGPWYCLHVVAAIALCLMNRLVEDKRRSVTGHIFKSRLNLCT